MSFDIILMDLIESFLCHTKFSSRCKVSIDNQESFDAVVSIKFVFLIIYAPEIEFESVVYLPDYGPAISFGCDPSNIILFVPIGLNGSKSFTIENEEPLIIDQIFQLATNAILTLNSFIKQIQEPISFQQHVVAIFPPNDLDRPVFLILKNNKLLFDDNGTILFEIEINTRTDISFSEISSLASVGVSDKLKRIIRIQSFPDESTMKWFLVLMHTKYLLKQEDKKAIDSIAAIKDLIEYQKDEETQINNNENQDQYDNNRPSSDIVKWCSHQKTKEANNLTEEESSEELKIKTAEELINEKSISHEMKLKSRFEEEEENKKEKIKSAISQNEKTLKILEQQRLNFKPKENMHFFNEIIPSLQYPNEIYNECEEENEENEEEVYENKEDNLNNINNYLEELEYEIKPKLYSREEMEILAKNRFDIHRINMKHYFKNPKPDYVLQNYTIEYDEHDKTSFLEAYIAADPEKTFKMLLGIILCGFVGKSVAEAYSIKGTFDNINEEAHTIVESFGTSLPQFILSNRDSLLPFYKVSSIVHDVKLLKKLPHKDYITITYPIEPLYSFSHRPILEMRESTIRALISCRIGKFDPFTTFKDFSRGWTSFFSNNLRTNNEGFFVSIANEIENNEEWDIFKGDGEMRHKTALFLLTCMKKENLMENTLLIFNYTKIISEHYNKCASIRSKNIAEEFLIYVQVFSEFHIKITNEGIVEQPLPGKDYNELFVM